VATFSLTAATAPCEAQPRPLPRPGIDTAAWRVWVDGERKRGGR